MQDPLRKEGSDREIVGITYIHKFTNIGIQIVKVHKNPVKFAAGVGFNHPMDMCSLLGPFSASDSDNVI
jgi:hypothetical protein